MAVETPNTTPIVVDAEYQDAIQPVVDNNMRTDILGPHFCRVLKDHNPARVDVVALITEAICADPKLKDAVKSVVTEHNKDTKMRWFDRALGVLGTIVLALVIWGIQYLVTHPGTFQDSSTSTITTKTP